MYQDLDIDKIAQKIGVMKQHAEVLRMEGADFPALERNVVRILASLKMLEINISEVVELNKGI